MSTLFAHLQHMKSMELQPSQFPPVLLTQVTKQDWISISFHLVKNKEALSALSQKVKVFGCESSTKKVTGWQEHEAPEKENTGYILFLNSFFCQLLFVDGWLKEQH